MQFDGPSSGNGDEDSSMSYKYLLCDSRRIEFLPYTFRCLLTIVVSLLVLLLEVL